LKSLASEAAQIKAKIAAAKKRNFFAAAKKTSSCAAKEQELLKAHDKYCAEVGVFISCFQIKNTDLPFLFIAPAVKKKVEVKLGPFTSFTERKVATAIQKFIFPWGIAIFGLSFQKM
jgi:hypothetical protein